MAAGDGKGRVAAMSRLETVIAQLGLGSSEVGSALGPDLPLPLDGKAMDSARLGGQLRRFAKLVMVPGRFVLYGCHDDLGVSQGRALVRVSQVSVEPGHITFTGEHIAASDGYYESWAQDNLRQGQVVYHLCECDATRCGWKSADPTDIVVHVSQWTPLSAKKCFEYPWAEDALHRHFVKALSASPTRRVSGKTRGRPARAQASTQGEEAAFEALLVAAEKNPGSPCGGDQSDAEEDEALPTTSQPKKASGRAASPRPRGRPPLPPPSKSPPPSRRGDRGGGVKVFEGLARDNESEDNDIAEELAARARAATKGEGSGPPKALTASDDRPRADKGKQEPSTAGGETLDEAEKRKRKAGDWLLAKAAAHSATGTRGRQAREDEPSPKRKKKKSRKERGRKRRRSRSTSSSSSSSGSSTRSGSPRRLFHKGLSLTAPTLRDFADQKPGELLKSGLREMQKYLKDQGGADQIDWVNGHVLAYINQVLFANVSQEKMGVRNAREIRTLAEAIDCLLRGQLARLGDLLMQRLKAVESAVLEGAWTMAKHQELIPDIGASLSNPAEREAAAKAELRAIKLRKALEHAKGKGGRAVE